MGNNPISLTDPDGGCTTCEALANSAANLGNDLSFYGGALGGLDNFWHNMAQVQSLESVTGYNLSIDEMRASLTDRLKFEDIISETGGTVTWTDSRFDAFTSHLEFADPSARFNGLFKIFSKVDNAAHQTSRISKLDDVKIDNIDILQGSMDLGSYSGNTLRLNINSIQKTPLAPKDSGFTSLIQYAEHTAKHHNLDEVILEFGPVMNSRLANDPTWA